MTKKCLALAAALVLAFAGGALAQIATGNIYGVAKDESGAVLPGANVTLTSDFGTQSTVSSADGTFRFLSLSRGDYTLTLALSGFAKTVRKVRVTTGENLDLTFNLKVSGVQETVEVTGESPLVDTKKRGTATTMTTEELNGVPSARDPWGVLKAVPGVLVDRVNIAGNENGQQANSSSKGSVSADQTWNLDGINITDMSATGSSPTYFDFGAFEEITVTTGGTDLKMQSGGSGVNMVTKRGTNAFHGSARYLLANHQTSFANVKDQSQSPYKYPSLATDPRLQNPDGSFRDQADHIEQISEYGFDLGGPIVKDKLWFYGTYGKQDIRLQRLAGTPDKTLLPSWNAKLNWQASSKTMVSAFYFEGQKQKFGRSPGTGLQEADGILWNQTEATTSGWPAGLWKIQVDQTFSPNLVMSANFSYYNTGFGLVARGDPKSTYTLDYVNSLAAGTYQTYLSIRPQKNLNVDGSYFFQGLGGTNELKFGFGYRDLTGTSSTTWPGNQIEGRINSPTESVARVFRDYTVKYGGKYISGFVGDTLSLNRFTVNAGVRYDYQSAKNLTSVATANASFPDLLPTATYPGGDNLNVWKNYSPRVGMSYALDEAHKTVLRATYARYYQQLSFGDVAYENPTNYSYLAYGWKDLNHDGFVQPNEVDLSNLLYWSGVDPQNPSAVGTTPNKVDRNRKPKHDDEFIVGLDYELVRGFAIGAAFTYRTASDWNQIMRLAGVCSGDPTLGTCPVIAPSQYIANAPVSVTTGGQTYTAFTYSPPVALYNAGGGGNIRTTNPYLKTHYKGLELTLNKRLANKWMARAAFSWNDWTRSYPGAPVVDGRALAGYYGNGNPTPRESESFIDGDQFGQLSGGSGKGNLFYTSFKWQIYANALYQIGKGFDLSGSVYGRQGGLFPVYLRLSAGKDGSLNALASPTLDALRYPNVWDFDLRLAKTFKFGKQPYLTLAAEWFNVGNSGVVLGQIRQANSSSFHRIDEILSPGIARFSATLGF